ARRDRCQGSQESPTVPPRWSPRLRILLRIISGHHDWRKTTRESADGLCIRRV
ncbi:MAG: hypothetical protein AVDCRST_MAG93-6526, partial [uncultured Chloroflexia bacterium]